MVLYFTLKHMKGYQHLIIKLKPFTVRDKGLLERQQINQIEELFLSLRHLLTSKFLVMTKLKFYHLLNIYY